MTTRYSTAAWAAAVMMAGMLSAKSQQTLPSTAPGMAPDAASDMALNSESGTVDELLAADDGDYHWLGYLVRWNNQHIFVPDPKHEVHLVGKKIAFTAAKSTLGGSRVLRFTLVRPEEEIDPTINEAKAAEASITLGTAPIEETLTSESMGYRFVAYVVTWHGKRVVVVDRTAKSSFAAGDKIDFKVLRSVAGTDRQLSFILTDSPKAQ